MDAGSQTGESNRGGDSVKIGLRPLGGRKEGGSRDACKNLRSTSIPLGGEAKGGSKEKFQELEAQIRRGTSTPLSSMNLGSPLFGNKRRGEEGSFLFLEN